MKKGMQSINKLIYSEHSIPFIVSVRLFLLPQCPACHSLPRKSLIFIHTPTKSRSPGEGSHLLHCTATSLRATFCSVPLSSTQFWAGEESSLILTTLWWFYLTHLFPTSCLSYWITFSFCLFIFLGFWERHSTSQVCSGTISWWHITGFLEYFGCLLLRQGFREPRYYGNRFIQIRPHEICSAKVLNYLQSELP